MEKRDIDYMRRCIQLARNGQMYVSPNPMVGCVIVYEDTIIGEGFHRAWGYPHAEAEAIHSVADAELLRTSTLYVNLEPCTHYGKTPPCTNLIIEKKIPRVVIGCLDFNPEVTGSGTQHLREAGVDVQSGVCQHEALQLNKRFLTFHKKKRPYVILKWAQSADGYMDPVRAVGQRGSIPISGQAARRWVHTWRSQEDAILVGSGTVWCDDPQLTPREVGGKPPLRVVIDTHHRIPDTAAVFHQEGKSLVLGKKQRDRTDHTEFVAIETSGPLQWLEVLYQRNILSVLVEGGAAILNTFIAAGLWDEARIFTAPLVLGDGLKAPSIPTSPTSIQWIQKDQLAIYERNPMD